MAEENAKAAADLLFEKYQQLTQEISKTIIGQEDVIRLLITSIFCNGHSLLVGVPGLAKTLLIQTISRTLSLDFSRIQFTPDLMPSDILGAETLDKDRNFHFINRTPPKTQSALLESMQEYSVTIAGKHFGLDRPFFVLATQNPIEQEGTYPLPEAQLDRFMMMIKLSYPDYESEVDIIKKTTSTIEDDIQSILSKEEILKFQQLVRQVPAVDNVIEYAVTLVQKTRPGSPKADPLADEFLEWGAGPRAGQFLILGAKCHALISGKYAPDIEDVQAVATPIMRHRIMRNFKAEAEGISEEEIISRLL